MNTSLTTTIEIEPAKEQIAVWTKKFVPENDLFFISKNDLRIFEEYLSHVFVIPRKEFFNHSTYNQIQFVNSYLYWNISAEVEYVIVAPPSWITYLPKQKKKELFKIQIRLARGLIFSLSLFPEIDSIPEEYMVVDNQEQYVVIQCHMWNTLPHHVKEQAIKAYAQLWDHWTCYEVPVEAPIHIKTFANSFPILSGSNCLSATLFAITGQEWMAREWVHPATFINGLKQADYSFINDDNLGIGDVIAWVNEEDVIQHACYHIGNDLFFNKNGQTFFNPWKVVHWDELNREWSTYKRKVYRKRKINMFDC